MTFLEAALEILKRERKPLHYKELTEKAMERKLLTKRAVPYVGISGDKG